MFIAPQAHASEHQDGNEFEYWSWFISPQISKGEYDEVGSTTSAGSALASTVPYARVSEQQRCMRVGRYDRLNSLTEHDGHFCLATETGTRACWEVQQTLYKDIVLQTFLSRHGDRYRSFGEIPQNQLVVVFIQQQRQVRVSSGPVVEIATRGLSRTAHSILSFCVQKADRTL